MTQEQEEKITTSEEVDNLAKTEFDRFNKINTKQLSIGEMLLLRNYLEERLESINKTLQEYVSLYGIWDKEVTDEEKLKRKRRTVNFHNWFFWSYMFNYYYLRKSSLRLMIEDEIKTIKF